MVPVGRGAISNASRENALGPRFEYPLGITISAVSIGAFVAFKVVFSPLEYIPSIPPLSSYIINIYLGKGGNHIYLMTRDVKCCYAT